MPKSISSLRLHHDHNRQNSCVRTSLEKNIHVQTHFLFNIVLYQKRDKPTEKNWREHEHFLPFPFFSSHIHEHFLLGGLAIIEQSQQPPSSITNLFLTKIEVHAWLSVIDSFYLLVERHWAYKLLSKSQSLIFGSYL